MANNQNVKLSDELKRSLNEFAAYRAEVNKIIQNASENYATLKTGFEGSAEEGYQVFYTKAVDGFFQAGGSFDKFLKVFDDPDSGVLMTIQKTFTGDDGMDPSLGEQNRSSAGSDQQ